MKSDALGVSIASADHHLAVDDRYIPIRYCDLVQALCESPNGDPAAAAEAEMLRTVAAGIEAVSEQDAARLERELADVYAPFDPDCDVFLPPDADRSPEALRGLIEKIEHTLDQANFEPLSDVHIERAIATANSHGLKVRLNPNQIDFLRLWVRGRGRVRRNRKTWRHPIKGEMYELDVFRRLAVLARLRGERTLLVKIFKDIPECDLEALLPHAEVEMTWLDRAMMLGGGAGAMGTTGWKVFNLVTLAFSRLLWIILFGLATLVYRVVTGYRRARQSRISQRTQHLYFQNLSNNAASLHKLTSLVAAEEAKEALLVYAFCLRRQGGDARAGAGFAAQDGDTVKKCEGDKQAADDPTADAALFTLSPSHLITAEEAALGREIEAFLLGRFGVRVDFDLPDALAGVERLGLWAERERLRVTGSAQAPNSGRPVAV